MQTNDFINRVSTRLGYKREFFKEKNIPTTPSNLIVIPFYGDLRSLFILSSMILKPYKDLHRDKYVIVCSWPGFQSLFPYVDEYWTLKDESSAKILAMDCDGFLNKGNMAAELQKVLLECVDIVAPREWSELYSDGFTQNYWDAFKEIKKFSPEVISANSLPTRFKQEFESKQGKKIFVFPATKLWSWQRGRNLSLTVAKDFWSCLLTRLIEEGYVPVVYQNWFTYDMSGEFLDKCVYCVDQNVSNVLAAMRYTGLVLDIHSGISRLAIAARTPFLCADERLRFVEQKDYEIDDLCCETPRKYIFSFSTMLMVGGPKDWKDSLLDNIIVQLNEFCPALDRSQWGSTNESYDPVSYDKVRKRQIKRMGLSFISSSKTNNKTAEPVLRKGVRNV